MSVTSFRIDPEERRRRIEQLKAAFSRFEFVGGQAQIGNNLEVRHLHRGVIQEAQITDSDFLLGFQRLLEVSCPELLMDSIMRRNEYWVTELITSKTYGWRESDSPPYGASLDCLESVQTIEDDGGYVILRFFAINETVILFPKESPLCVDLDSLL